MELSKSLIEKIKKRLLEETKDGDTLNLYIYPVSDYGCSDTYVDVKLSQPEIFYLLSKNSKYPQIFDGLELKPISPEEIESRAYEEDLEMECFPDGNGFHITDIEYPHPLSDLIDKYIESDSKEIAEIESQINKAIADFIDNAKATIYVEISEDSEGYIPLEEDKVDLELTPSEARKCLIFSALEGGYEKLCEDFEEYEQYCDGDLDEALSSKLQGEYQCDIRVGDISQELDSFLCSYIDIIENLIDENENN